MTKLIILALFTVACSNLPKYAAVKKIPAKTEKDASFVIQNQLNFLTMLFEQSRDPYYGVPKWTEKCLKENKIGSIVKIKNGIQAVSELYFDQSGSPGHCSDSSVTVAKGYLIYLYCDKQTEVQEIKTAIDAETEKLLPNLCL